MPSRSDVVADHPGGILCRLETHWAHESVWLYGQHGTGQCSEHSFCRVANEHPWNAATRECTHHEHIDTFGNNELRDDIFGLASTEHHRSLIESTFKRSADTRQR
jgi:hypothetical protein